MFGSVWSPCGLAPRMGTQVQSYFCSIFQWCNKCFSPQGTCVLGHADGVRKMSGTEEGLKQIIFRDFICMSLSLQAMQLGKYFADLFFFFWQIKQGKAGRGRGNIQKLTSVLSACAKHPYLETESSKLSKIWPIFHPHLCFFKTIAPSPTHCAAGVPLLFTSCIADHMLFFPHTQLSCHFRSSFI